MNFLQDDKGNLSSARLMSFVCIVLALVYTVMSVIQGTHYMQEQILYVAGAFGLKTFSKFLEGKNG